MQKILLAIDGITPNANALNFASFLARLSRSKVTGVFLENAEADEELVVYQAYETGYLNRKAGKKDHAVEKENVEKHIEQFKEACESQSVRYSIHRDIGVPAKKIIAESRYADVMVVSAETSFTKNFEGVPPEFVKEVLKDSECPVIIAPESFDSIDEIVFTFNGSKSAVFAIKQFCYLFPQLEDKKVTVIEIEDEDLCSADEKEKFKEWLSSHYSSIGFEVLKGDTESELLAYLLRKKNIFIVMGAYGRSTVSQFFKHSRADLLIKTITQAIFITHY
jgi:nucleotide-binding universal stress UspA family protein